MFVSTSFEVRIFLRSEISHFAMTGVAEIMVRNNSTYEYEFLFVVEKGIVVEKGSRPCDWMMANE